jgi:hypothetical protein
MKHPIAYSIEYFLWNSTGYSIEYIIECDKPIDLSLVYYLYFITILCPKNLHEEIISWSILEKYLFQDNLFLKQKIFSNNNLIIYLFLITFVFLK